MTDSGSILESPNEAICGEAGSAETLLQGTLLFGLPGLWFRPGSVQPSVPQRTPTSTPHENRLGLIEFSTIHPKVKRQCVSASVEIGNRCGGFRTNAPLPTIVCKMPEGEPPYLLLPENQSRDEYVAALIELRQPLFRDQIRQSLQLYTA